MIVLFKILSALVVVYFVFLSIAWEKNGFQMYDDYFKALIFVFLGSIWIITFRIIVSGGL